MSELNWITCTSSNVDAIAYDEIAHALYVRFKSGGTYRYDGVPAGEWLALQGATSVGRYLNQFIKGAYASAKI